MATTPRPPIRGHEHSYEVEWTTISYRTIAFYASVCLVVAGFILYLIAPKYFTQKMRQALETLSAGMLRSSGADTTASKREAHFVNLDGTVRVKRAQSLEWVRADYNVGLVKGDFVQTGSDGVARLIFADGTNYMLKPDSLIVVEETLEDPVTKATRVSVEISSGAVDLSTGKFGTPGSTSKVAYSGAVASLAEDTRASLLEDPKNDTHRFTVQAGQADVTRASTTVRLGQYDQVTFSSHAAGLIRQKVIAPPSLLAPPNMELTVSKDPKTTPVTFAWEPVSEAVGYRLQVSPSGMFSNLVVDKKVMGKTAIEISGLDEGTYYWVVRSIDSKGVESEPGTANRFILVQQAEAGSKALLEISKIVQHGRVVEVVGRTEPGSTVIINNEQVFSIASDGTFRHFTSPLPKSGSNVITITAQNRKGDTNTIRKNVVIE